MNREIVYTVRVEFGDCDPARIVWFPNFFRWLDAASRNFFTQCGVAPWHETEKTLGTNGTPLVDTHVRFVATASYGDTLQIHTSVKEWRSKSFVHGHRVMRGETLILECEEVRIFSAAREDDQPGIRAVPIPTAIRSLCE